MWRRYLDKKNAYRRGAGKATAHANTRARQAGLKTATPAWVDRKALKEWYKNRPEGYHVDHIIALNNPIVWGLHVPWNLQYLPEKVNIAKDDHLPPLNQQIACPCYTTSKSA